MFKRTKKNTAIFVGVPVLFIGWMACVVLLPSPWRLFLLMAPLGVFLGYMAVCLLGDQ